LGRNLKKYEQDYGRRKEIIHTLSNCIVGDQESLFPFLESLHIPEFVAYFRRTWMGEIKELWDYSNFPAEIRTNNFLEREFKTLKSSIHQTLPLHDVIEELYIYSKVKLVNVKSKVFIL
jgi:hypothetical protein